MSSPNPCSTCGACCRSYVVPLAGRDVWLISREQRLSPEQFAVAYVLPDVRPEGFRLRHDGPLHALALDKRGRFKLKKACVFLVTLPNGMERCGVYAHRPAVCHAYPMVWRNEGLALREKALCPPDSWSDEERARPSWREKVQRLEMQFDVYAEVVARWNARVAQTPDHTFSLVEYFSYVVNAYEQLAELDEVVGEEDMARILGTWRAAPRRESDLAELRAAAQDYPWIAYLDKAAEIVRGYYPWVPQPADEPVVLTVSRT